MRESKTACGILAGTEQICSVDRSNLSYGSEYERKSNRLWTGLLASAWGPVAYCYEHCSEPSGSKNSMRFCGYLSD